VSLIAGTASYLTTVYVTAASSGDGDIIAAAFNGLTIGAVDVAGTATATNASGVVTISWTSSQVRAGDGAILTIITNMIAGMAALTTPVTHIYVRTEGKVI
jgi:hypothetical protein